MENQDAHSDNLEVYSQIEEQKVISLGNFIILCIASFGLYSIWWIYKEWRFFQQKDNLDIMPAARAIFSIIFLIPLFNKILTFAKKKGYTQHYSSTLLFIGFFIGNLLSSLPDPLWLISIFSFVFFIPPFNAINYAKQNSNEFIVTQQDVFSGRQIGLIIIGLILWILILLGMFMTI